MSTPGCAVSEFTGGAPLDRRLVNPVASDRGEASWRPASSPSHGLSIHLGAGERAGSLGPCGHESKLVAGTTGA